jgi:hypothetical protein
MALSDVAHASSGLGSGEGKDLGVNAIATKGKGKIASLWTTVVLIANARGVCARQFALRVNICEKAIAARGVYGWAILLGDGKP